MYIGMCVGHYKSEQESRIEKVKRLAAMGFKYLNGVSVPGDAPKSELREMKAVVADLGIVPVQCGGGVPQWGTFDPAKGDEVLEAFEPMAAGLSWLPNYLAIPLVILFPILAGWGIWWFILLKATRNSPASGRSR